MAIWVFIVMILLIKVPIAAMMLWLPFRHDSAVAAVAEGPRDDEPGEEDNGGNGPSGGIRPRWPRPRRGPHQGVPPRSPSRVRGPRRRTRTGTRQRLRTS